MLHMVEQVEREVEIITPIKVTIVDNGLYFAPETFTYRFAYEVTLPGDSFTYFVRHFIRVQPPVERPYAEIVNIVTKSSLPQIVADSLQDGAVCMVGQWIDAFEAVQAARAI